MMQYVKHDYRRIRRRFGKRVAKDYAAGRILLRRLKGVFDPATGRQMFMFDLGSLPEGVSLQDYIGKIKKRD